LEILEYCEPSNVIAREQFYLDLLKPEYNVLPKAGNSLGYKHTEDTLAKLREIDHPGRFKKGHQHTKEAIQKRSEARLGISLSEDTRRRVSAAKKGMTKIEGSGSPSVPIEVLDLETDIKTTYDSMSEAARALGINKAVISEYLSRNRQKPYKNKYRFYYL
jgi:group I intron endonuclease